MKTEKISIKKIKLNPNNPRVIRDEKFQKLVKSIQEFPEMLEIRPIVVNADSIVLGGNMRLKACQEAGLKEIPVLFAEHLTEEQQRQFIIKDNIGYGEWDWEMLANEWNTEELKDWGIDVPMFAPQVDYSILDEQDISEQLNDMTNGVMKAIQIEFEINDYEVAQELIKFWRERKAYIGGMIIQYLKTEKNKL